MERGIKAPDKIKFGNQLIVRWGDYSGFSAGPNEIIRALIRRRETEDGFEDGGKGHRVRNMAACGSWKRLYCVFLFLFSSKHVNYILLFSSPYLPMSFRSCFD